MPDARCRVVAVLIAVVLLAALSPEPLSPHVAVAQMDAPATGAALFEDTLTAPVFFRPFACPSGRGDARFGPDGLTLRTSGRCIDRIPMALVQVGSFRATVIDGDIEVDTRITASHERAYVYLQGRLQTDRGGYALVWYPHGGVMQLTKSSVEDGGSTVLARQTNLPVPAPGAWTRLSMRFQRNRIWALMDGTPILTASDSLSDEGGVAIGVIRRPKALPGEDDDLDEPFQDAYDDLGVDDDEEVSIAVRKLRVSALAGGAEARAPTIRTQAELPPAASPGSFVPAAGTPPALSDVMLEQALDSPSIFPTFDCPTRRGSVVTVGEGLMLKANGVCKNGATLAPIQADAPGLTVPDGAVHLEFKVANGQQFAAIGIAARMVGTDRSYAFTLAPGRGWAYIVKLDRGEEVVLARRTDLRPVVSTAGWNSIDIGLLGGDLWLSVNDRPALRAHDEGIERGGLAVLTGGVLPRDGSQEVAVVFRNLRVSAVGGSTEERRPTYVAP